MSSKRKAFDEYDQQPHRRRFFKERAQTTTERMRPLDVDDLTPPAERKEVERTTGSSFRKGKGSRQKGMDSRRAFNNKRADDELIAHFNAKIALADEMRGAFSFIGQASSPAKPNHAMDIETRGIRNFVTGTNDVIRAKIRQEAVPEQFEHALMHVSAALVSAKLFYAHSGSEHGLTERERSPDHYRLLDFVRSASINLPLGVVLYIDNVGKFSDGDRTWTPYLRGLRNADQLNNWRGIHARMHHTLAIYSETFRRSFAIPGRFEPGDRVLMEQLGIAIPAEQPLLAPAEGVDPWDHAPPLIPAPPPGRDLMADLATVQHVVTMLAVKYPKAIRAVDVTAGKGSRIQLTAYTVGPLEMNTVWSPLPLDTMDLYAGAVHGFCLVTAALPTPPAQHEDVCNTQVTVNILNGVQTLLLNLMSKG